MSGKNEGTGKGEGSGTLRDEAGSSGQETTRGWGVLLRKSAMRQDLSSRVAAAPQDPVSEISGLAPLKAFLVPQEGDNDVVWVDEENKELTGFQIRVLDRMKELRDKREELALSEGDTDSRVRKLDEELLNLKAFLNTAGNGALDGSSVMFDVERIAEQVKRESQAPRESAHNIAPALEEEGVKIPDEARPTGLGVGRRTPGGMAETGIWNTLEKGFFGEPVATEPMGEKQVMPGPETEEEVAARASSVPVRDSMIVDETEMDEQEVDALFEEDAVRTAIPPKPERMEEEQEEMVALIGGYPVLPLNKKERKLLSRPDELGYVALREMALERRWQAEVIERGLGIADWEDYEWLEDLQEKLAREGRTGEETWERVNAEIACRLEEADALEIESDRLNPANQGREEDDAEDEIGEGVPKGTVIRASASGKGTEAKGPSGAGVPKQGAPAKRIETVLGLNAVIMEAAKENSQLLNIRTLMGMGAAKPEEPETDMFAGFEEEIGEGIDAGLKEGSAPLSITHLMGEPPRKDPRSVRLPTAELRAIPGIAHLEGTGIRRLTPVERADTMIAAPVRSGDAQAKGAGQDGIETAMLLPVEDFSRYGDVYYTVEKVYMESTGIPDALKSPNNFAAMLPDAIKKAEILSRVAKVDAKKGETLLVSSEEQRVARLKKFHADFFVIPEGKGEPRKSFLAYSEWLVGKKSEYSEISEVHELLSKALAGDLGVENKHGVSPGEYDRIGMLRLCNAAIKKGTLTEQEERKVEKLREMLEPVSRGEKDIFSQTIAAEAAYEMIVGFATKQERAKVRRIEQELAQYNLTVAEFEAKREKMVNVLVYALQASHGAKKDAGIAKKKVKEALVELEPDTLKREKLVKLVMAAQSGKGEIGKDLKEEAKVRAAETVGLSAQEIREAIEESRIAQGRKPLQVPEQLSNTELAQRLLANTSNKGTGAAPRVPEERVQKQYGPVASGLGSAIKMAAGAGILAAGLWLGQNGITLPSFGNGTPEKEVASEVESTSDAKETVSAGVLDSAVVDAGKVPAAAEKGIEKIARKDAGAIDAKETAPKEPAEAGKEEADAQENAEAPAEEVQEPAPKEPESTEAFYNQPRTPEGLKKALDNWSEIAEFHAVDKATLRAAYASVENVIIKKAKKDNRKIPLPGDSGWAKEMLRSSFSNPIYEIAVMSDLWRLGGKSIVPEDRYAAGMRLAATIGYSAGDDMGFTELIAHINRKAARKDRKKGTFTLPVPELGKDTLLGKTDYNKMKSGGYAKYTPWQSNCLVSSTLYDLVVEDLGKMVENEKILAAEEAVLEKLSSAKELGEEKYQELAGEIEGISHYFVTEGFDAKAIEIIEGVAGKDAGAIVEKIREGGIYKKLPDDLKTLEGVDNAEIAKAIEEVSGIRADKMGGASKKYLEKVSAAVMESVSGSLKTEKGAEAFSKRINAAMERSMKERERKFMGRVNLALGAMDDAVFERFKNAKWEANQPRKNKKLADACRVFTQNKKGLAGLAEAPKVNAEWKHKRKIKKRKEARAEEKRLREAEEITSGAISGDAAKNRPAPEKAKAGKKKTGSSKEESNVEFLERQFNKRQSEIQKTAEERRRELFSYRGGIGADNPHEAKRLEKREAYLAQFSARMGVEDRKGFPKKAAVVPIRKVSWNATPSVRLGARA